MYCKKCNAPLVSGEKFCAKCSTPVLDSSAYVQHRLSDNQTPQYIADAYKIVFCIVSLLAIFIFFVPISFNGVDDIRGTDFFEKGTESYHEILNNSMPATLLCAIPIIMAIVFMLKNKGKPAVVWLIIAMIFVLCIFFINFDRFEKHTVSIPHNDSFAGEEYVWYEEREFGYVYNASYLGLIEPCLLIAGIITAFLGEKNKTYEKGIMRKVRTTISYADELKKYKELLDSGAISEAEYMEKKKQILNQ